MSEKKRIKESLLKHKILIVDDQLPNIILLENNWLLFKHVSAFALLDKCSKQDSK